MFLFTMRHFRNELIAHGITVHYTALADTRFEDRGRRHADLWAKGARGLRPSKPHCNATGQLSNPCNCAGKPMC
jgi:deoxyribodipyrimidine photolyase-like uncharacterized protein